MKPIGEGNGNPLQCSCLENPRDGGAWWAAVSGVAQSQTRLKRLSSNETYADFLARLKTAISHSVIGKKPNIQLEKLLAYENTNKKCQKAIAPIHETGTIIDYLKACHNLGSKTQEMQMLAETVAAYFKRGNKRCFTCVGKNHLKKDCPKKANKKPPKICPCCRRKMHWVKDSKSKFDIKEKPILRNSKQGTPRSPSTKTRDKFHLFPQTLNIQQCCHRYTSPK